MAVTAAIVSGGMDSITLAHLLRSQTDGPLALLSFDYGQRHSKELEFARVAAANVDAEHRLVDLRVLRSMLAGSSLTSDDIAVPDGHYAEESMKQTVVPNRNAIMLAIATGYVVSNGGGVVATGVHAGDHFIYPDCRPEFVSAMSMAMTLGSDGLADVRIEAPFVTMSKADIASLGDRLGVDWAQTWSCYKGGNVHCGVCGTCTERREAFEVAGVADPTAYADETRHW